MDNINNNNINIDFISIENSNKYGEIDYNSDDEIQSNEENVYERTFDRSPSRGTHMGDSNISFVSYKDVNKLTHSISVNSIMLDNTDIQNSYIHSNSPLTMSENNSDNSEDDEIKQIRNERFKNQINGINGFKKKDYHDVEKSLAKYYDCDDKYSSKLDILITFMKGQKHVFSQSKVLTHAKLNLFIIPILLLSSTMSIVAPLIQNYYWAGGFISGLNIIIATLVSMMNYMKYESYTEKFFQLANQYDKMEISLEMANNKLLFLHDNEDKTELVLKKISDVEIKINELKEYYTVLIPDEIKKIFPVVCNINIFSMIKKMEIHKKKLIHKFKDVKNEIRFILFKWKNSHRSTPEPIEQMKEKNRLLFLYDVKEKIKAELMECRDVYSYIDELFTKEIKNAEKQNNLLLLLCCGRFTRIKKYNLNPILDKYFHVIFQDV